MKTYKNKIDIINKILYLNDNNKNICIYNKTTGVYLGEIQQIDDSFYIIVNNFIIYKTDTIENIVNYLSATKEIFYI